MKKGVKIVAALIAMSILTASSVMLVTSACITGESWWPLFALFLAVLSPFPVLLFGGVGDRSSWQDDDAFARQFQKLMDGLRLFYNV